jgi:hypothetical protein
MKRKKSNVLKYIIKKVQKDDRIKGIKLVIHQKRLSHKILGFIPVWSTDRKTGTKSKEIILWKPDLKKYPKLINNDRIQKGDWLIMEKDFETYSHKIKIKHICLNKKLLRILTKY